MCTFSPFFCVYKVCTFSCLETFLAPKDPVSHGWMGMCGWVLRFFGMASYSCVPAPLDGSIAMDACVTIKGEACLRTWGSQEETKRIACRVGEEHIGVVLLDPCLMISKRISYIPKKKPIFKRIGLGRHLPPLRFIAPLSRVFLDCQFY